MMRLPPCERWSFRGTGVDVGAILGGRRQQCPVAWFGHTRVACVKNGTAWSTHLLSADEVAQQLRVSTMTVYRLIRRGELPAVRVGRNYRVRTQDLAAYLDAQVVDPATVELSDAGDS